MSLFLRGVVWFALYLTFILAPAIAAAILDPLKSTRPFLTEFSVALGFLAFSTMLAQFALVSRMRASSRPFGTDALVQFHQYVGFVCLALVITHPLLLNLTGLGWSAWSPLTGTPSTRTGAIALWLIVALVATTTWRRRLRLSYEWWEGLHLALAAAAAISIVGHVLAVSGYTGSAPLRWVVYGYAGACAVVTVNYRLIRPLRLVGRPWEILSNDDAGGSVRTLRLRPVGHDGFEFEPGQFAWLVTGRTPLWAQQHPLSISSSAELSTDRTIEFSVKRLGDWSSAVVPALRQGTRVWVDGPFGAFTTDRTPGQGFVFIVGGIGIAPVRSMLLSMRDRGDRRHVLLFYAVNDETRIICRAEIEALVQSLNLDVVYVLDHPSSGWSGERGRLTADLLARHLPPHFKRYHYFVCGPPAMMDSVEALLRALAIPAGSIESERFNVV